MDENEGTLRVGCFLTLPQLELSKSFVACKNRFGFPGEASVVVLATLFMCEQRNTAEYAV